MATQQFIGRATAVAQVSSVQITAYDAATAYKLTVGGVTVSASGGGSASAVATALAAAWNASTHLYFSGVTATPSTDTVILTADVAGVPFTVSAGVTGGSGTIGSVTAVTASAGPNHWDTAANWSSGSVPTSGDSITLRDCDVSILWGLDRTSDGVFASLSVDKSFTGRIGLPIGTFTTRAGVENSAAAEYRETWLKIKADAARLGEYHSTGQPSGSSLCKVDFLDNAVSVDVFGSGSSTDDKPATRLRMNHADSTLRVYGGAVAIADDRAADTSTLASAEVFGPSSLLVVGAGVTQDLLDMQAGNGVILNAPTTVRIEASARLTASGTGTIDTLEKRGDLDLSGGAYEVTTLKG